MKKIVYTLTLFFFCSCSNFLSEYSQDLVVVKTVSDLDEILLGSAYLPSSAVGETSGSQLFTLSNCGAFLNLMDDDSNGVITLHGNQQWSATSGQLFGYNTWQQELGPNWNQSFTSDDSQTWFEAYKRINAANIILDELTKLKPEKQSDIAMATRVRGEALFIRAQMYLLLANLYSNAYVPSLAAQIECVPLKLTGYVEYDSNTLGKFKRDSQYKVYNQIVDDLKMSVECLTESPQGRPLHRASAVVSSLLLSRVYMYMQDWENAKIYAKRAYGIKSELANLATFAGDFMVETNPEILFSQGALNIQGLFKADGADYCISKNLVSLYDKENDYRYVRFFTLKTQSDSMSLAPKYSLYVHKSHVSDAFTLRTAEIYLNCAEACAMLGDAEANTYLNALRATRILDYVPQTYSGDELINQVRLERRKELCIEGHRWFDLRRYAVSEKLPYVKDIIRVFGIYDNDNKLNFQYAKVYQLLARSSSYTLPIPKVVLERDRPLMTDNPRDMNEYIGIINVDYGDGSEGDL